MSKTVQKLIKLGLKQVIFLRMMDLTSEQEGYQYDLFISIKNSNTYREWLESHFIPQFSNCLHEDTITFLGRPPKVFYYAEELNAGDPWPADLTRAIKTSRVAIALCSPAYFFSHWCLTEFCSFHKRLEIANARVLVPVSIHDGKNFPDWVRNEIQVFDLTKFVMIGDGFSATTLFVEFQQELRALSELVATRLKDAPNFRDWPIEMRSPPVPPQINQPRL